jgi:hypothetical protein
MRVLGTSIYLGLSAIVLLFSCGHELTMHMFNLDGTAGLGDISGKEITRDMAETGVIGHRAIVHLCARDGLTALTMCALMLLTFSMGTSYQKFYSFLFFFIMEACQVGLPFWLPWNGEKPPYFGDSKLMLFIKILLHPCTALFVAVFYDDDILERGPDYEKDK